MLLKIKPAVYVILLLYTLILLYQFIFIKNSLNITDIIYCILLQIIVNKV